MPDLRDWQEWQGCELCPGRRGEQPLRSLLTQADGHGGIWRLMCLPVTLQDQGTRAWGGRPREQSTVTHWGQCQALVCSHQRWRLHTKD